MKNIEEVTLSQIALEHHESIPVLEKYSLDFCCRGGKTLLEACNDKKIDLTEVANEIRNAVEREKPTVPFTEMTAGQLVSHILLHHHFYVKQTIPVITNMLDKIISKHGSKYPEMYKIQELFDAVRADLEPHMQKEEQVLFPRIREVADLSAHQKKSGFPPSYIIGPISVMETEHDIAGQLLFEIRDLTNNYTAPEDACTTHKVCLETLKAFETDLHQHVHLENNILFPLAISMVSGELVS